MTGFAGALLLLVMGGAAPLTGAAPDSVCLRTTHYFPEIRRSVQCLSHRQYVAWQRGRREQQAQDRLDRIRDEERLEDRKRAEERIRVARQDRLQYDRRQAERRRPQSRHR